MKNFNNLSKLFRYINDHGDSVTFDYAGGFLINKPTGIDTLSVTLSKAQGINQVGTTIQSASIQSRPVNVTGYLVGDAQAVGKERLLSVIRPDIGGRLYADNLYLTVRPTATPTIEAKRWGAQFQFSVLAAYPYWCRDDHASVILAGVEPLFKFPWNISREYRFGQLFEKKWVNVPNRGQVPVPYTAIFRAKGNVSKPKITNAVTGQFLVINKSMVSGEQLTVKITHDRTYCTSTVDGDCRGALALDTTLWSLDVGDNVLKPEAESGLDNLQVDIDFATETVGISL